MPAKLNQRIVRMGWKRSRKLYALGGSVVVHIIVLAVFGAVRFSRVPGTEKARVIPNAKISEVKRLIETASIIPKPVMKTSERVFSRKDNERLAVESVFDRSGYEFDSGGIESDAGFAGETYGGEEVRAKGVEFFGSWSQEKRICYVVDRSGSMKGVFRRVAAKLQDSVSSLLPDQYFYIIFYGGDRLFEFNKGKFVRASNRNKAAAISFIGTVRCSGSTNAMAALEKAIRICGSESVADSTIYFLTDGFELASKDSYSVSRKIANMIKYRGPKIRINTIGFWPSSGDKLLLERIAEQSDGQCSIVRDDSDSK